MISRWGIRSRVLLAAILPVLVLAVLMTAFYTGWRLSELEQAHAERGRALARQLSAAAEFPLFAGNREALRQLANNAAAEQGVLGVQIRSPAGNLLARAGSPPIGLPERPLDNAFQEQSTEALRVVEPVRPARLDIEDDLANEAMGSFTPPPLLGSVIVDLSREPLLVQRAEAVRVGASALLVVMLGSLVLARLLGRGVSQPVRQIAEAVARIGEGHLDQRVPVLGGGSLGQLARGFNEMAERLAASHEHLLRKVEEATAELRERKDEAERASLAKSRFLAAASHDLRQPMHALGLFVAELAQRQHPPETERLVQQVATCAEAMEGLLDSLLDLSRLDAGVLQPSVQAIPLQSTLDRIGAQFRDAARARGLRLRIRPSKAWVATDPLLLERILANLVSNAIRYTLAGGVMVGARRRGEALVIEVRDSGIGIPDDAQDIIFHEFVQLDQGARARTQGMGLGLAIVRRLVDLLGHRIELRSRPDEGSVFSVTLPLAAPPAGAQDKEGHGQPGDIHAHVALLGRNQPSLASLEALLRNWGAEVSRADSPAALAQAVAQADVAPDILLFERHEEGTGDALTAIDNTRRLLSAPGLTAVLISADTDPATREQAQAAGVILLNKPVRPARLRALLARLLDRAAHDETAA